LAPGDHFTCLGSNEWHTVSPERVTAERAAYSAPDPYAAGLKKIRAATAPTTTFETEFKALRQRAVIATRDALDAHLPASSMPRLTTAELRAFTPPDPYAEGLVKMRRKKGEG